MSPCSFFPTKQPEWPCKHVKHTTLLSKGFPWLWLPLLPPSLGSRARAVLVWFASQTCWAWSSPRLSSLPFPLPVKLCPLYFHGWLLPGQNLHNEKSSSQHSIIPLPFIFITVPKCLVYLLLLIVMYSLPAPTATTFSFRIKAPRGACPFLFPTAVSSESCMVPGTWLVPNKCCLNQWKNEWVLAFSSPSHLYFKV